MTEADRHFKETCKRILNNNRLFKHCNINRNAAYIYWIYRIKCYYGISSVCAFAFDIH